MAVLLWHKTSLARRAEATLQAPLQRAVVVASPFATSLRDAGSHCGFGIFTKATVPSGAMGLVEPVQRASLLVAGLRNDMAEMAEFRS